MDYLSIVINLLLDKETGILVLCTHVPMYWNRKDTGGNNVIFQGSEHDCCKKINMSGKL